MTRYRALAGDSGVTAYGIGDSEIAVRFVDGRTYTYTYDSAGPEHVENMKRLARGGQGLSTYISRYVRDAYAARSW